MNAAVKLGAVAVLALVVAGGCKKPRPGNLVGQWEGENDGTSYTLTFNADKTWSMTGANPNAFSGSSVSVSGTWALEGSKLAYQPLASDVSGATMSAQQAKMVKEGLLKPETNSIDFQDANQFTESGADGRKMVYRRVGQ